MSTCRSKMEESVSGSDCVNEETSCAAGVYSCVLTLGAMTEQQVKVLGMSMSGVRVEADVEGSRFSGERVSAELQVNPGFYSDQTHVILSSQHTTAEFSVYGATGLLQHLQVRQHASTMAPITPLLVYHYPPPQNSHFQSCVQLHLHHTPVDLHQTSITQLHATTIQL